MEFSRTEYWSGSPFPSPGDLPNSRIELRSPALQADSLPSELPEKPSVRLVKACKRHKKFSLKRLFEDIVQYSEKYKNQENEDYEKCVELVLNLNVIHNVKNKRINNLDLMGGDRNVGIMGGCKTVNFTLLLKVIMEMIIIFRTLWNIEC